MNRTSDAECSPIHGEQEMESNREESLAKGSEGEDGSGIVTLVLFWSFVGIPLIWGVVQTFEKAMQLFE